MDIVNELGQPVGSPLPGWSTRPLPAGETLHGRYCRLERLDPDRHADRLFEADRADVTGAGWTYLPYGPFADAAAHRARIEEAASTRDPLFYAVVGTDPRHGRGPVGVASLMRTQPEAGVIEVGHVHYSPALQRTRAATEAQYLLAREVFEHLGYRRLEWKCDALNAASRAAARRLGFTYEGTFRRAGVVKGRNRDTAWFSIHDAEWPDRARRLHRWLDPDNFDPAGRQRSALVRAGTGPDPAVAEAG